MSFAIRILDFLGVPPVTLPASAGTVVLTALSILITTPAAYLSWRYVEVPFINLGKAARYRAARA
jgi:peptidoglycan/LPS O-acetylase OafA/YrhL